MSGAIRDLTEGEFIGPRDMQNNPLPSRFPPLPSMLSPHHLSLFAAVKDWRHRNILSAASLLGNSCKGALILARHDIELQEHAYEFGKHLALASQVPRRYYLKFLRYNFVSRLTYEMTSKAFKSRIRDSRGKENTRKRQPSA